MRVGQKMMARLLAVILLNSSYSWTWYKWVTRQRRVLRLGRGMMAVRISCSLACWASTGRAKEGDKEEEKGRKEREREHTLFSVSWHHSTIHIDDTHSQLTAKILEATSSLISGSGSSLKKAFRVLLMTFS